MCLEHEDWTPSRVWASLDSETRREAGQALYRGARSSPLSKREADLAIAAAIRFRESAVRQLPTDRRIAYLVTAVRPDDSLASTLLIALHLERRAEILETLLGALGVPNEGGLIDDGHDLQTPTPAQLVPAVEALYERFAAEQVDLYLSTLLALDDETWGALRQVLRERMSA